MDKGTERERERKRVCVCVCVSENEADNRCCRAASQSLIYSISQRKSLHIPNFPQLLL